MSTPHSARHDRIVAHFDLDAFYVCCERELNPTALLGVPVAVSQYNPYGKLEEKSSDEFDRRLVVCPGAGRGINTETNGSLIAVSYEARAASVKRNDRGHDAVRKCPELRIVQVPVKRGKADLTMYRDASYRVLKALASSIKNGASKEATAKIRVEKASIDEIYIDLTSVASEMAERVVGERDALLAKRRGDKNGPYMPDSSSNAWREIVHSSGASSCTTIGGVEDMSDHALAANGLSKDELRRGSHLQVLDSSTKTGELDQGSKAWWHRDLVDWTDIEIGLACGAALAAKARAEVASFFSVRTNDAAGNIFTLSAGVSSNKTLAKLASGLKKPNRQTLINPTDDDALQTLFHPLPIGRIRGLGGKFGCEVATKLDVATIGDIARLPLVDIEREFPASPDDDTANFLYHVSRGICREEVSDRTTAKSIACGKTFRNQLALDPSDDGVLQRWAGELCGELTERLSEDQKENNRIPKLFSVSVKMSDKANSVSRSVKAPRSYEQYTDEAVRVIKQVAGKVLHSKITGLTVFASSFVEIADESTSILAAFGRCAKDPPEPKGNSTGSADSDPVMRRITTQLAKRRKAQSLETFWSQAQEEIVSSENLDADRVNSREGTPTCSSNAKHGISSEIEAKPHEVSISGSGDVDPEVLSQLPFSIRAELQMHARDGNQREDNQKKGLERWMARQKGASEKQESNNNKNKTELKSSPKRNSSLGRYFDKGKAGVGMHEQGNMQFTRPSWDEIDQETLMELPSDVREAIVKDMNSAKKQGKRKRIDAFFSSKSKSSPARK